MTKPALSGTRSAGRRLTPTVEFQLGQRAIFFPVPSPIRHLSTPAHEIPDRPAGFSCRSADGHARVRNYHEPNTPPKQETKKGEKAPLKAPSPRELRLAVKPPRPPPPGPKRGR